jgi:hypothetical protein
MEDSCGSLKYPQRRGGFEVTATRLYQGNEAPLIHGTEQLASFQ